MLRFASSPTGDMSIESLRIALFNYILSKQSKEDLLIQIEDIEKEKIIEGKDREILEILNLFSIDYSKVIYQSENLKYHQKMAMQLLTQKKAFSCFCSKEKLEELYTQAIEKNEIPHYDGFCATLSDETVLNTNAPFTVRIKMPNETIRVNDLLRGEFDYTPEEVDAFIILNHDKTPTYNYACAIDDMLYNITTVIQSERHLSNTPKQIYIRKLLGYTQEINYIHLPIVENEQSVQSLISQGFLPAAIANYLVLLGNKTPTEIFTLEEAISWFSIENLSQTPSLFEMDTLRVINQKHLETMDNMRLSKLLGFADEDIGKLGKLYLNECSTLTEIKSKIDAIFSTKPSLPILETQITLLQQHLKNAPFFEEFNELKAYLIKQTNLTEEEISLALHYILTGETTQLDISKVYTFIKNYLGEIIK